MASMLSLVVVRRISRQPKRRALPTAASMSMVPIPARRSMALSVTISSMVPTSW
jgi:hypothetical protein